MSSILVTSPAGKKGRYSNDSSSSPSGGFKVVGDLTDLDCFDNKCETGKLLAKQGNNGVRWFECNQPGCSASANKL